MIDKIEIHEFKSIRSLSLELGKINVFLGANGAGKSNILEALGVISTAVYGIVDDESLQRRGVRPGVPKLYKTSNKHYKRSQQISFAAVGENCEYKISLLNPLESPRPQWDYKTETFIGASSQTIYTKGVRSLKNERSGGMPATMSILEENSQEFLFMDELRSYAIYNPNTPMLRGIVPDPQTRIPVGLSGGGLSEGLADLLQVAVENEDIQDAIDSLTGMFDWVKDVSSKANISTILSKSVSRPKKVVTFVDRFMTEKSNTLTAYDASEGVLFALFVMVLCLSVNGPKVFAVDNIDQALNPRLVKAIIHQMHDWFTDLIPEKQILFTAHNPAVLDGVDFADDDFRVFIVERDNQGLTGIQRIRITNEVIEMLNTRDITLSQLWMEGYFGGVPNV